MAEDNAVEQDTAGPTASEQETAEAAEAAVRAVEDEVLRAVERAETAEARHLVALWAEDAGHDLPERMPGERLSPGHDPNLLQVIRDAMTKTGALAKANDALETKRRALAERGLENLRARLEEYDALPRALLDGSSSMAVRAETLGKRIRKNLSVEGRTKHREILIYLAMSGRIDARHALCLTAYLALAEQRHVALPEMVEKAIELEITDTMLSAGAVQGLQVAGISLMAFAGLLQLGAAAAACCFAKQWVRSYTDPKLPAYTDFYERFYSDLDGQADAVHEQVQAFLEGFLQVDTEAKAPSGA